MPLSPKQRLALINHVNALVQADFERLVFVLNAPRSVIPSSSAALGERSSALFQWVEGSTGCGMDEFLNVLNQIAPLPAGIGPVFTLPEQLDEWFKVLGYGREPYEVAEANYFEWMITIPVRRKRYDRVVVRGVIGEAGLSDLDALRESVATPRRG